MTKLSIITINLNNADGLRQTINSVVAQNLNDVEYLVIDGGSTDGSIDVIHQFEERINYWVSESDSGIYNAMNKAIVRATGEYLLFLNSGDCLVDDQVFNDVIPMLKTEDLIAGNILIGDRKKNYLVEFPDRMTAHYIVGQYIGHPSTFIKRSLFEKQLYSEELKIVSDWEFFLRSLIIENCTYKHIDRIITLFDPCGISASQIELVRKERSLVLRRTLPTIYYDDMMELVEFKKSAFADLIPKLNQSRRFQRYAKHSVKFLLKIHQTISGKRHK